MKKTITLLLILASSAYLAKSQELVKDIYTGSESSLPYFCGDVSKSILFYAKTNAGGDEIWFSDGTSSGTKILKDINPGKGSSSTSTVWVKINTNWFFMALHSATDISLWKTDGTEKGTEMVKDLGQLPITSSSKISMVALDKTLYFSFDNISGGKGKELWKSDGTGIGTVMVKDINPAAGSNPTGLISFGNHIYFFANDGTNGNELWRSNGTDTGTKIVKDIYPGSNGSFASLQPTLFVFKNKIYFAAQGNHDEGVELYRTDGTGPGTKLFMDINTQVGESSYPVILLSTNDFLFIRADDGKTGFEPWISDGNTTGTKLLKDIYSGVDGSYPNFVNIVGNKIVFGALNPTNGAELWVSDGTPGSTQILKDIIPGDGNSYPFLLTKFGSKLYFAAIDSTYGTELWETDGTSGGTKLQKDLNPGKEGSQISGIYSWGGKLYISAKTDKDAVGVELYKFTPVGAGGFEKVLKNNLSVFPNPVQTGHLITVKHVGNSSVSIFSTDGKMIYSGNILSNETSLKLPAEMVPGIYIIRLENSTETLIQKIHIIN